MDVRSRLKKQRGFTMLELLAVVMIIAILGATSVTGILRVQKSTEQLKFDRIAESLYHTAQNQLSQRSLMYGGNTAAITPIADEKLNAIYAENEHNLYYVTNGSSLAKRILPEGSVSADVRDGSWIVEYEPESYRVYSVFYSDLKPEELLNKYQNVETNPELRADAETRSSVSEGHIGYYSGDLPDGVAKRVGRLDLSLNIQNGEELIAEIRWVSENASLFGGSRVGLTVAVTGRTSGNTMIRKILPDTVGTGHVQSICLDSLQPGLGFCSQFCERESLDWWRADGNDISHNNGFLYPGEWVTVTVTAETDGTLFGAEASGGANSLFADTSAVSDAGYTADIACGRHLQNLDTATSGCNPALFGATAMTANQTADVNFNARSKWHETYETSSTKYFTPISNSSLQVYRGNYCPIRYLTVDQTGHDAANAGLFGTFGGSRLEQIVLEDPVIRGSGDVGGLAGALTGETTIRNCRVYMSSERIAEENERIAEERGVSRATAAMIDWMTGGGSAGGLVGSVGEALTIETSFAATVVKGGSTAGGLVGDAAKTLTVSGSYADCYVDASTLGGLAGSCGSGSAFTSCYSAGFVLFPAESKVTAGFVPSTAKVSHCYTIFCFDDPMDVEAASGTEGAAYPKRAPNKMKKYALTKSGSTEYAYYTYDGATANGAKLLSSASLAKQAIDGFSLAGDGAAANPYGLVGNMSIASPQQWDYPVLPLPHYNDFYSVPESPVSLTRVIIQGATDEASVKSGDYGVAVPRDGWISAHVDSRLALGQVFVGWFDEDAIGNLTSDPAAWARDLEQYDIHPTYWWYMRAGGTRLVSVNGQQALTTGGLPANPTQENERIRLPEGMENRKVYAVYREVQTYNVGVWYMRYDADSFTDDKSLAEKYLGGARICQPDIYMVDPVVERTGEHTFDLPVLEEYEIVTGVAPFYGFDEEFAPISAEEIDVMRLDRDKNTLRVKIDKPYVYSVLYYAEPVNVDAEFHFGSTASGSAEYAKVGMLREALKTQAFDTNGEYVAKVAMGYPENASVLPELGELNFEGFTLERAENTVVKADEPVKAWFTRNQYELSYDLDGGVYYDGTNKSSYYAPRKAFYREQLTFPEAMEVTDVTKLTGTPCIYRLGYRFDHWELYPFELNGTEEGKEKMVPVSPKGYVCTLDKTTGMMPAGSGESGERPTMSAGHVIAKAVWRPIQKANIRLEIYVQDVNDAPTKTERNYVLYNTYSVGSPQSVDTYSSLAETELTARASELMEKVYATAGASVSTPVDGARSYLGARGGLSCPQLTVDSDALNSCFDAAGKVTCLYDDTSERTAVFKVYLKRNLITFHLNYTGENGTQKAETFTGLYEAPFSENEVWPKLDGASANAGQEQGTSYNWSVEVGNSIISDKRLSFLDSFYYEQWINNSNERVRKASELTFNGNTETGKYGVFYYLEPLPGQGAQSSDGLSSRDQELRELVNSGLSASEIAEKMEKTVMARKEGLFTADPVFVQWSKDGESQDALIVNKKEAARLYFFNDGYPGYTEGHFKTNLDNARYTRYHLGAAWKYTDEFKEYQHTFLSWEAIKADERARDVRILISTTRGILEENPLSIRYNPSISLYETRNTYNVYFNNISWNGKTQMVDYYLYGASIDRLPDVANNEEAYRPIGIGDDCRFVGWNTRSDGRGEWMTVDGSPVTPFTAGEYVGSKWRSGQVTARSGESSASRSVTMPSSNLTLYAIWRHDITVNYYTMLTADGDVTEQYGESKRPASTAAYTGMNLSRQLAEIQNGFGMSDEQVIAVNGKQYRFTGWYQATDAQIADNTPPYLLTQRFDANSYLSTDGDTLNLVACWEQTGGLRSYTVRCLLYSSEDASVPTEVVKLTNAECGYSDAAAGQPLTVRAPTGEGASPTSKLYKLLSYSPKEPSLSVSRLDNEHSIFTFHYYQSEVWSYEVDCYVNLGGYNVLFKRSASEEMKTGLLNIVIRPDETIQGYVLHSDNMPAMLEKNNNIAKFYYDLAPGAIEANDGTVTWDGETCPSLLTFHTEGGKLSVLDASFVIRTTVTLTKNGNQVLAEQRTLHADGSESIDETQKPAAGTYSAKVKIVVIGSDGEATVVEKSAGRVKVR